MAKGVKTGGRQRGTPNKVTAALRGRLEEVMRRHNYDPYEALLLIASDEANPLEVRIHLHTLLMRYTYPEKAPIQAQDEPTGEEQYIRVLVG